MCNKKHLISMVWNVIRVRLVLYLNKLYLEVVSLFVNEILQCQSNLVFFVTRGEFILLLSTNVRYESIMNVVIFLLILRIKILIYLYFVVLFATCISVPDEYYFAFVIPEWRMRWNYLSVEINCFLKRWIKVKHKRWNTK